MVEKILRADGTIKINGEEIQVLDIVNEPKEQKLIKTINENPKPVNQSPRSDLFWRLCMVVFLFMVAIGIVWANVSFQNKDFTPKVNNTINVEPASVSVPLNIPVNNTYEINTQNNVTTNLDKSFLQQLLNLSNHS